MVLGIRSKSKKRVSVQVHYIIHVQEIKPWPPSQSLGSAQSVLLQWENGDKNYGSLPATVGNGKIEINESFMLSALMWREASKRSKHRESFQKNYLEFFLYDKTAKSPQLGSASINLADFGIIKETKALSVQLNCKRGSRSSSQPFLNVSIQPIDLESSSSSPNSSLSKEFSLGKEESESASQSQSIKDDDDVEIASFTDDDSDDTPSNTFKTIKSASQITGDTISKGGTKGSQEEFVLPLESTSYSILGKKEGEASSQFNGIKSSSSSTVLCSDMGNAANGNTEGEASSQFNGIKSPTSSKVLFSNMGNAANDNTEGEASSKFNGIKSPSSSKVLCSDMGNAANGNTEGEASSQFNGIKSPSSSKALCSDMGNAANSNTEGEASSHFNGIKSPSSSTVVNSDMGNAANGNTEGEASSQFNGTKSPSSSKVLLSDMGNTANGNTQDEASSQFNGIKSPSSSKALCSDMGNAANSNTQGEASSQFNGIKSPSSSKALCPDMGNAANSNTEDEASSQFNGKSRSLSKVLCSDMGNAANRNTKGEASSQFNGIKSPSSAKVLCSDMGNAANSNTDEASSQFNGIKSPSSSKVLFSDMGNAANGNREGEASSHFNGIKYPSSSMVLNSDMGNAANGNTEGEASSQFNGIKSPSSSTVLCSNIGNAANGSTDGEASSQFNGIKSSSTVLCSDIGNASNGNIEGEASSQFNSIKSPSSSKVLCLDMGNVANDNTEGEASSQFNGIKSSSSSMVLCLDMGNVANGNIEGEASSQFNGIKSPSSSTVLCSDMGNEAKGSPSLPKFSKESIKLADASFEIQESIEQSSASYMSSSMKQKFERYFPSQVTQEDSMIQEDGTRDQTFNKDVLEKVSSVPNTGVMEDKEEMEGRRGQEQFTMRNEPLENELVNNVSDDGSTKQWKLNSTTLLLNKESHEHPTSILMNDKTEDVTNVNFPLQSTENCGLFINNQTHNQAEEINTMNDVHVGTACHEDVNVNDSFLNNKTELKTEVEMLREELREAAALEVSMYSVIAEHASSSNKVHAPARRLSRFYFHACRVGSPATIASAAQSAVSGFVLVSKACGNDVPRLTFWFSNILLLKAIVSKGVEYIHSGDGPCINNECDATGSTLHEEKDNTKKHFNIWQDPETFLVALEKVEAWIFSRIVESVWWQTLTPYMQSAAAKSSSSRKACERRYRVGDQDQGSFSVDLWKRAFTDACDRLCPIRAGGHECGCLPVIARLVMEQLVSRLDVAMFNAILRESAEEMPMDPISDPISDSKVLPIPAGKSGFGAGAQLKNAIGDWSRWLSDLFSIDDSDSLEVSDENDEPKFESSFKPFQLLNALSDLMMLPLDMLADASTKKEVCPRFGISIIKRVVYNFVPDEFSPGPVPDAVLDALNDEDIQDGEGSITSLPCSAGSTFYAPPPASLVMGMLQEVGTKTSLRRGSFVLKKLYTSDDELDELDSPLSALGMDESSRHSSKEKIALVKGGRKVVRYDLLREAWKSTE